MKKLLLTLNGGMIMKQIKQQNVFIDHIKYVYFSKFHLSITAYLNESKKKMNDIQADEFLKTFTELHFIIL